MLTGHPTQISLFAPPPRALPPTTTVYDLDTGAEYGYSLDPESALRACFAQTVRRDFNTWNYAERYGNIPVSRRRHTLSIGSLCVMARAA